MCILCSVGWGGELEVGRIVCLTIKKTKMAAMSGSSKNDALYISLLGLAENFRVSNPPNIRLCIHCLQSIFNINPPPLIASRTHLQLGNILLAHTKNKELATRHLEQAVSWICIVNLSFVKIGPDFIFLLIWINCVR